jgi:hypothetical protein
MIYSIVLPITGCSVFTATSCNSSYPQRNLIFNILGTIPVVGHTVRNFISFFSLSLAMSLSEFNSVLEKIFNLSVEIGKNWHYLF